MLRREALAAREKTPGLTLASCGRQSLQRISAIKLPPYAGRVCSRYPSVVSKSPVAIGSETGFRALRPPMRKESARAPWRGTAPHPVPHAAWLVRWQCPAHNRRGRQAGEKDCPRRMRRKNPYARRLPRTARSREHHRQGCAPWRSTLRRKGCSIPRQRSKQHPLLQKCFHAQFFTGTHARGPRTDTDDPRRRTLKTAKRRRHAYINGREGSGFPPCRPCATPRA